MTAPHEPPGPRVWYVRVRGLVGSETARGLPGVTVTHEGRTSVLRWARDGVHTLGWLLLRLQALGLEVLDVRSGPPDQPARLPVNGL